MKVYFSPTKIAFYPYDLKKDYDKSQSWPEDSFLIEENIWLEFGLNSPPIGKTRGVDAQGLPCWVDVERTLEDLKSIEFAWMSSELIRIREELEKVQDSDFKAKGSVADWRNYRKALRMMSESLGFPDKHIRPKSPDS